MVGQPVDTGFRGLCNYLYSAVRVKFWFFQAFVVAVLLLLCFCVVFFDVIFLFPLKRAASRRDWDLSHQSDFKKNQFLIGTVFPTGTSIAIAIAIYHSHPLPLIPYLLHTVVCQSHSSGKG